MRSAPFSIGRLMNAPRRQPMSLDVWEVFPSYARRESKDFDINESELWLAQRHSGLQTVLEPSSKPAIVVSNSGMHPRTGRAIVSPLTGADRIKKLSEEFFFEIETGDLGRLYPSWVLSAYINGVANDRASFRHYHDNLASRRQRVISGIEAALTPEDDGNQEIAAPVLRSGHLVKLHLKTDIRPAVILSNAAFNRSNRLGLAVVLVGTDQSSSDKNVIAASDDEVACCTWRAFVWDVLMVRTMNMRIRLAEGPLGRMSSERVLVLLRELKRLLLR